MPPEYKEEAFQGFSECMKDKFAIVFKLIDYQSANMLIHHMVPKQYMSGTVILEKGHKSDGIWFIIGGSVKVTHSDNLHIDLLEFESGTYFGDVCLMNKLPGRSFM